MTAIRDADGFIAKLNEVEGRFDEIGEFLQDPRVFGDPKKYKDLVKERGRINDVVSKYRRYKKVLADIEGNRDVIATETDQELLDLAQEDLGVLLEEKASLEAELKKALIPRDPNDDKNAIVEIRAGTGGSEAALFAGDLFRMYGRYAESRGWKTEILTSNPTDLGGFKEVIFAVEGDGVYRRLKYEGGVHRVQRIPLTESGGRIHTSTATVAVLPESEEIDEMSIDPDELRIDTYCSSGKGGQGVNTTYSAVRITHLPSGIVVTCQDERSQIQNRERAMRILRSRLQALAEEEKNKELTDSRRSQVGTGERAEKIRTYNFPQSRVTDHRIGFTSHRLTEIMDGDLDEMVGALLAEDERLKIQDVQ
ncbi:MAG: peptide chain release factor 1 [Bacillota bacterium]